MIERWHLTFKMSAGSGNHQDQVEEDTVTASNQETSATPKLDKNQKTLFSYFKGTPKQSSKPKPKNGIGNGKSLANQEQEASKRRRTASGSGEKEKSQAQANGNIQEEPEKVKSPVKKKAKEDDEGSGQEGASEANSMEEEEEAEKAKAIRGVKSIKGYFSMVTKSEFLDKVRQETETKVIEVRAQVHSPMRRDEEDDDDSQDKTRVVQVQAQRQKKRASRPVCAVEHEEDIQVIEETTIVKDDSSHDCQAKSSSGINGESETVKVSNQLFRRNKRQTANGVHPSEDDDVLSKKKKKPASPVKQNEQPADDESPELFKKSRSAVFNKLRTRKRKVPVNYDSDSLDMEVLSKIADKSKQIHADGAPFTALIEKPLVPSYVDDDLNTEIIKQDVCEVQVDKSEEEEKPSSVQVKKTENNAFALLMNPGRKKKQTERDEVAEMQVEVALPKLEDAPQVSGDLTPPSTPPRKKGRPKGKRKVANRSELLDEASQSPAGPASTVQVEEDSESSCGRRTSSRLRNKRSLEQQKSKEEMEMNLLAEAERTPKAKRRGRKRTVKEKDDDDDISIEEVVVKTPPKRCVGKLAPIFMTKKQKEEAARAVLPAEDPAKVAARQAFLQSSVPDEVRAQMGAASSQDDCNNSQLTLPQFSDIGHIRQLEDKTVLSRPSRDRLVLKGEVNACPPNSRNLLQPGQLCSYPIAVGDEDEKEMEESLRRMNARQIYQFVQSLKMAGGSFPLSKTFSRFVQRRLVSDTLEEEAFNKNMNLNKLEETRMLRGGRRRRRSKKDKKKEEEEPRLIKYDPSKESSMQWTMKYAPSLSEDIIGKKGVYSCD